MAHAHREEKPHFLGKALRHLVPAHLPGHLSGLLFSLYCKKPGTRVFLPVSMLV